MSTVPIVPLADIDAALARPQEPPPAAQPTPAKADLDRLLSRELRTPKIRDGVVYCENMEQIRTLARHYISAGMVPKGLDGRSLEETEARVMIGIEFGTSVGLTPLQSLQSVLIVNNRPVLWGDAPMSLVAQHRDFRGSTFEYHGEGDKFACTFEVHRNIAGTVRKCVCTFSVEDAKKAGLWGKGGPWSNYPKRMMMYRARAFCLRDTFPDALRGAGIAEEFDEFVAPREEVTRELQAKLEQA